MQQITKSQERASRQPEMTVAFMQVLFGVVTIVASVLATWFTVIALGVVLAIRGAFDLIRVIKSEGALPKGPLIVGVLFVASGVILLSFPQVGASILSLLLGVLFIVGGAPKLLAPFSKEHLPHQSHVVITGLISVFLGILVFLLWPLRNYTIIGALVGLEILLNGLSIALAARVKFPFAQAFQKGSHH